MNLGISRMTYRGEYFLSYGYGSVPLSGSGGLVVMSRLWGRTAPGSKPDSTEDPACIGSAALQILPTPWCDAEAWRGGASSGVALII
ncbi:hypothetical protein AVEN_115158-1 [Araneus ventricosus]|uniref:Uncharacterized protein n=1 Tax=Araneus ventricosus TaxID=182803 RepID=A0A4Y1ZYH3_ARAVE|nr:hypothetical protein AVEN_115158-1 [Araneus ventricosus]